MSCVFCMCLNVSFSNWKSCMNEHKIFQPKNTLHATGPQTCNIIVWWSSHLYWFIESSLIVFLIVYLTHWREFVLEKSTITSFRNNADQSHVVLRMCTNFQEHPVFISSFWRKRALALFRHVECPHQEWIPCVRVQKLQTQYLLVNLKSNRMRNKNRRMQMSQACIQSVSLVVVQENGTRMSSRTKT